MKKANVQGIAVIAIFLLTIFGFFIFTFVTPSKSMSLLENRKLAQRPDLNKDNLLTGEYSKRFEQYYNDQFPMRDSFIETNALINKNFFRQNIIEDVYVADDGYLLSQIAEVTPADAKQTAGRINELAAHLSKKNVSVYTALMPNKSTMMENKFPAYFPSYGQKNMNLLYKELEKASHPIDSRAALNKHMNEDYMFFYTDHHWQAKAAFYAYQNVMSEINANEPIDDQVYQYSDYDWKISGKPFYGSDARKTTSANAKMTDAILVAELKEKHQPFTMKWGNRTKNGLYNMDFLTMEDPYTNRYQAYLGGDYAHLLITNPNKSNGKKVLVIKDSYANAFIQFLVPHYKETHVLDLRHYNKMPIEKYVEKNNIDQVILLNNINSIFVTPALTNFNHPGQGENQ
ncbi:DHHW family protein [Neobacillus sp. MER 74]|uniref:DHHW family protein n=1 Tax=Neobacillus sp. MER 74 TaxID=2939566 RepID=UPI00203A3B79|nr:DHHW family protein [Neobacillus sp. MER 74]MCM3115329.1 DHHW family protein [Neobacillus sp. MER 74]